MMRCIHHCMHKGATCSAKLFGKGRVTATLALRVITYLNNVEFNQLNHGEAYNVIKSAASYEDCFASAMSYNADIIMQIDHPVYRVQDLFLSFENYEEIPTILAFYVYTEDTIIYAVSSRGRNREELRSLFIQFFGTQFKYILDFGCDYEKIAFQSGGSIRPRLLQLEASEYLTEMLRGTTRHELGMFRKHVKLDLEDSGYYLYAWYLRDAKGLDYSHHKNIKDIYNLIGALLQAECQEILARHWGGEVFYDGPRHLFALINAPGGARGETRQEEIRLIVEELTFAMGTSDANRYLSGYFKSIEGAREAHESINDLRMYNFFCRDAGYLSERYVRSIRRMPKPGEVEELLSRIQYLITYDTGSPEIEGAVQWLFLNLIKPSMDYELFAYCFSNVSSFIYQKLTERFQSASPIRIPVAINRQYSTIEIECANLISAVHYLQSDAQAGVAAVKNPLINKAIKYIQKNYAEDISLITLSQYLNISSVYLSQLFKKELGTSPIKFIINYRIERAKELLKETDDTIYNIAVKVGFWESKHFSKTFKRVTGVTPMQYKKSK